MVIDQGDEMGINKIIKDYLPDEVTLPIIQQATKLHLICKKLITSIQKGYITEDLTLKAYIQVFSELTYKEDPILQTEKLFIPDAELVPG